MRSYFLIAVGCLFLNSCTILRSFPQRSELTLKAEAASAIDKPNRKIDSTLELHGSNRDVLAAYLKALEFTLQEFNLKK